MSNTKPRQSNTGYNDYTSDHGMFGVAVELHKRLSSMRYSIRSTM